MYISEIPQQPTATAWQQLKIGCTLFFMQRPQPPPQAGIATAAIAKSFAARLKSQTAARHQEVSVEGIDVKATINRLLDVTGASSLNLGSLDHAPSLPAPAVCSSPLPSSANKGRQDSSGSAFKQHTGKVATCGVRLEAHQTLRVPQAEVRRSLTRRKRRPTDGSGGAKAQWSHALKTGEAAKRLRAEGLLQSATSNRDCCLVDPRASGRWLQYWDALSISALLYVALVTPCNDGAARARTRL